MTKASVDNKGSYSVDESTVQRSESGYSGDAVNRLAEFENMYADLIGKQAEISAEMEKLRSEGRTNTVKFKQLLANKLTNNQILVLFESYGLE
jgi:hypothetical protein